jgi:MFS family permease
VATMVGFAALGVGVACVVPAVFSAAGRAPGMHAGTGVATVAGCGWAGYVCGPPLIGALASVLSLRTALGLLPLLTAFIAVTIASTRALGPVSLRAHAPGPDRGAGREHTPATHNR